MSSLRGVLLLVLSLAACGPPTPPAPEPAAPEPAAAEPAAPRWRRAELSVEAVPPPDLAAAEPAVAEQLDREYRRLEATWQRQPLPPPAELARAFGAMGRLYHAYEEAAGALPCYRNARAFDPTAFEWPYLEGVLLADRGELDAAAESFETALALRPGDLAATLRLATARFDQNRLGEARRLLEEAAADPGARAFAAERLGRIAALEGDPRRAVEQLELALSLEPRADRLHYLLAQSYRQLGERDKAEAHLARYGNAEVRFSDPYLAELGTLRTGLAADLRRGLDAARVGDLGTAVEQYRRAVAAAPDDAEVRGKLAALGEILSGQGRHGEAAGAFAAVAAAAPDELAARLREADEWFLSGDCARSRARLEAALARWPDQVDAENSLARVLVTCPDRAQRDAGRALGLAQKAFAQLKSPYIAETLAMIYAELGRFDDAVSWQRAILSESAQSQDPLLVERLRHNLRRYEQGLGADSEI